MLPSREPFAELFTSGLPLMDTRAPVEFGRGSFPGAISLPLMADEERAAIGTCYKNSGQEAAIALGHQIVSGDIKASRIQAWADYVRAHSDAYLFCFRGGLRSQIVQRWLAEEAGIVVPRIAGGYKAMRHFLMSSTDRLASSLPVIVIGGMTGTGKTEFLKKMTSPVDLEGCANHRGSGFGKRVSGQPAQIDFEHRVACQLLQAEALGLPRVVLEDEGQFIGSCSLPASLYERMQRSPILWLEDSFENRESRILRDYVVEQRAEHDTAYGLLGAARFAAHLLDSLFRIRKRLGGERYDRAKQAMQQALSIQESTGDAAAHREWIGLLLREYYDPMYVHQKAQKQSRILYAGPADYLQEKLQIVTIR